jgi:hypothetical protein
MDSGAWPEGFHVLYSVILGRLIVRFVKWGGFYFNSVKLWILITS